MKKIFSLLLIVPLLSFSLHKYYVSLTQIEYVKDKKSIQIIMNVFVDDLEKAINSDFSINSNLNTENELNNIDSFLQKYLSNNLSITINNTLASYKYIGKEYDKNIIYFYLEIENINQLNSIEITNNVLIKHFPKQQNLIKIKANNQHKSLLLTISNNNGMLNF